MESFYLVIYPILIGFAAIHFGLWQKNVYAGVWFFILFITLGSLLIQLNYGS